MNVIEMDKKPPAMTEGDVANGVMSILRRYIWLPQFRIGVGFGPDAERTVDLFGISLSKGYERAAVEIKVSRSDFNRELRQPNKRMWAAIHCNRFYFAAPEGLLKPEEMPLGCGLIEVCADPQFGRISLEAALVETNRPTWKMVAAMARRIAREEQKPLLTAGLFEDNNE